MEHEDWDLVYPLFKPKEFQDPQFIDRGVVFTLYELRKYVGRKFTIHCDVEKRKGSSWHNEGKAIDGHFEGMDAYDQYEAAGRFDDFNGIGFYLWWNSPGIHLDTRPHGKLKYDSRWFSPKKGIYLPVTAENLRRYL